MTTQTLEAYEATEQLSELGLLDDHWAQVEAGISAEGARHEGRVEALSDLEDTIVETLDRVEASAEDALAQVTDMFTDLVGRVGGWVADLHLRLSAIEALLRPEADFDLNDLLCLEAERDEVLSAEELVGEAVNLLAKAMFHLGEVPSSQRATEAEDNLDYSYWTAIKVRSDLVEWADRVEAQIEAMHS